MLKATQRVSGRVDTRIRGVSLGMKVSRPPHTTSQPTEPLPLQAASLMRLSTKLRTQDPRRRTMEGRPWEPRTQNNPNESRHSRQLWKGRRLRERPRAHQALEGAAHSVALPCGTPLWHSGACCVPSGLDRGGSRDERSWRALPASSSLLSQQPLLLRASLPVGEKLLAAGPWPGRPRCWHG